MALQSSPSFDYDVFISFRGSDTRFSFTGNLYNALVVRGIRTFIDDRELKGGEEITPSLFKAIENSKIAIIVFSEHYASSSFCLDELSHIMKFFTENNRLVLPVFYGVEPTHVRHHTGSYGDAMTKHEDRFQKNVEKYGNYFERLQKWKMALTQASNLSGYDLMIGSKMTQYEYKFIENIVERVSIKINRTLLHVADYCVGLETRVQEVKSLLNMGSDGGVCIIVGIHGIGGIGKTTLAKEVYNSIANQFEVFCFLDDVREKTQKLGLVHHQETLLHETIGEKGIRLGSVFKGIEVIKQRLRIKKVLLILDDVDDLKQLKNLVGEPNWFGPGSKVIVTTRDKELLASHKIERTYEVNGLNREEALELLRFRVSKNNKVDSSYEPILERVVNYASGLPLALEVMGSTLSGKEHMEEWESLLSRYERIPHKDIQKILQVSYDTLGKEEQEVFLDIACCFKGYVLSEVECILCAHYGECMKCHIQVLVEKSLIKIKQGYVRLHDLVEAMGKEIVRRESPTEPGERSRLWFHEDIISVLENNTGTSQIKIIHLDFWGCVIEWDGDELKNMINLKTLIIKNGRFSNAPQHIPNNLRVLELEWCRYPSQFLPADFRPKMLSMCTLSGSCLISFRFPDSLKKFKNILTQFANVTRLDLSENNITILPECLKECRFLRGLILNNCKFLQEIRGIPPNLKMLMAWGCKPFSSSSIRMLLDQKLHEDGDTHFVFTGTDRIPEWFEHQSSGPSITFWFRNSLPSIALFVRSISICEGDDEILFRPFLSINGNETYFDFPDGYNRMRYDHTFICDLILQNLQPDKHLNKALLENEWICADITFEEVKVEEEEEEEEEGEDEDDNKEEEEDQVVKQKLHLYVIESGIHVFKQESSMHDIRFTNPYEDE